MKRVETLFWDGQGKQVKKRWELTNEGEEIQITILLLGSTNQVLQGDIIIHHIAPKTQSIIRIKSVVSTYASITLHVHVILESSAEGSKTWLESRSFITDETAHIHITPGLSIHTNNISAGHALSVSSGDDIQRMYLMSRGISPINAQLLLLQGFIGDIQTHFSQEIQQRITKTCAMIIPHS